MRNGRKRWSLYDKNLIKKYKRFDVSNNKVLTLYLNIIDFTLRYTLYLYIYLSYL